MAELNRYIAAVNGAFNEKDGITLADCLTLDSTKHYGGINLSRRLRHANIEAVCSSKFSNGDVAEMISQHLCALMAKEDSRFIDCYGHHINAFVKFSTVIRADKSSWMVPALHTMSRDTRLAGNWADEEDMKSGRGKSSSKMASIDEDSVCDNDHHYLRDAERQLKNNGFTVAINDRTPISSPDSKKPAALYVICNLFKIYFKLNTLRLCKNLIRVVEQQGFFRPSGGSASSSGGMGIGMGDPSVFPMAHLVTYHYYCGRIAMFEDDYRRADSHLSYSLAHCHRSQHRNKRRLLTYLVPVKLSLGRLPTIHLLRKYQLFEYIGIVDAVKRGDLGELISTMEKYQRTFIMHGTFLVLEKTKALVYRNLIKKIYLIHKSPRIPLSLVARALKWVEKRQMDLHGAEEEEKGGNSSAKPEGEDDKSDGDGEDEEDELDEIECILANLIYSGAIKGYISHAKRYLVVSSKGTDEAFPPKAIIS